MKDDIYILKINYKNYGQDEFIRLFHKRENAVKYATKDYDGECAAFITDSLNDTNRYDDDSVSYEIDVANCED